MTSVHVLCSKLIYPNVTSAKADRETPRFGPCGPARDLARKATRARSDSAAQPQD